MAHLSKEIWENTGKTMMNHQLAGDALCSNTTTVKTTCQNKPLSIENEETVPKKTNPMREWRGFLLPPTNINIHKNSHGQPSKSGT